MRAREYAPKPGTGAGDRNYVGLRDIVDHTATPNVEAMSGAGEPTPIRSPRGEDHGDRAESDVEITENDTSNDEPLRSGSRTSIERGSGASTHRSGADHQAARANPLEAVALISRLRSTDGLRRADSSRRALLLPRHNDERRRLMKRLLALTAAVIVLAVPAGAASPALASTCQPYNATGHDVASSPAGPYVGAENITIGSTTYSNVPAVTSIIAPLSPEGDSGVLTTTTSHTISLPSGTIATIDNVHLIATNTPGIYKLVSHLAVTGGATGQIQLQGTVNFVTLSADGTFAGTVCGLS
jgi:hypothetical protein